MFDEDYIIPITEKEILNISLYIVESIVYWSVCV